MSNKIICPVCNVPLTECGDLLSCPNDHCGWVGNVALWQALIQAKQDLEIARKALDLVANGRGDGQAIMREYEKGKFIGVREICRKALEQIEHKE